MTLERWIRFAGVHLTRSAYFLHKAASFSSGVSRVFSACISRTTSFPETIKQGERKEGEGRGEQGGEREEERGGWKGREERAGGR